MIESNLAGVTFRLVCKSLILNAWLYPYPEAPSSIRPRPRPAGLSRAAAQFRSSLGQLQFALSLLLWVIAAAIVAWIVP